jgi:hypothetical protein
MLLLFELNTTEDGSSPTSTVETTILVAQTRSNIKKLLDKKKYQSYDYFP